MGCGSTRVGVSPSAESKQSLDYRQTKGRKPKLAWSNKLAGRTSFCQLLRDDGGNSSEGTASPTGSSSNLTRTALSRSATSSLRSSHTEQQKDRETDEVGECLSVSPFEGQRYTHESGYQSADRSVAQEDRIDVAAPDSSSKGASCIKRQPLPISRVDSEGCGVLIGSRESVRKPSSSKDPLYVRLARLTAALDGQLCGTVAHGEADDGTQVPTVRHNEMDEVTIGRSRSIRSLRVYHGTHSEPEAIGRKVSIAKSVVKALVTRTLSNYGIVDSTSLDWESVAAAVSIDINQSQAGYNTGIGNSRTGPPSVARNRSSFASGCPEQYLGEELLWENCAVSPQLFEGCISQSHSCCSINDELLNDQAAATLSQPQQNDRTANRLSPAVSRKASSISKVSSVHSRSQLEDFVEQVSSSLMKEKDNEPSSAVHMLVLRPSLVSGSAPTSMVSVVICCHFLALISYDKHYFRQHL